MHMDVLACMTGVSRFQQDFPSPPLSHYVSSLLLASNKTSSEPSKTLSPVVYRYDKTEDPTTLLDPAFWTRFDYVLAERPETVIGSWEIVDTIYGFAGIEFLRPGAVSTSGVDNSHNAGRVWEAMGGKSEEGEDGTGSRDLEDGDTTVDQHEFSGTVRKLGLYGYVREWTRKWVTKGWWFGPKTEAKIRILRRIP